MKKSVLALTMAASLVALSACSDKEANSEVVVSSKAGNITQEDLYNEMKNQVGEQTLQLLIIEKVLEDKYEVTDEEVAKVLEDTKEQLGDSYEQYLASQGQTEEDLRDILYLNLLQEKALTDGLEASDEEVASRLTEINTEIQARHVLLDTEEKALEVKKKLEDGADFTEIAKEFSTEPAAQQTGGDLGWFGYGKMVPEFWNAAYALELNKLSDPVQSQRGFHIIEVTDKREVEENKKSEEDARKAVLNEKADPSTIIEKISKLLKESDVKVKDKDLETALDLFNPPAKEE